MKILSFGKFNRGMVLHPHILLCVETSNHTNTEETIFFANLDLIGDLNVSSEIFFGVEHCLPLLFRLWL
jgi:hypothetical protein